MIKIYVHHKFNEKLFSILFHNLIPNQKVDTKLVAPYTVTTDLESVSKFTYRDTEFEIKWVDDWKHYDDGINIVDWWEVQSNIECDNPTLQESLVWREIYENLYDKKDWIVSCFRTEKILRVHPNAKKVAPYESRIYDIIKKHKLVTDNVLNGIVIKNVYSPFTNMFYQWNRVISIKWFEEFKYIYDRLTHEYDLFFSVRNLKGSRVKMLESLSQLKKEKLGLQIYDAKISAPTVLYGDNYKNVTGYKMNISGYDMIKDTPNLLVNQTIGDNHWDDLSFLDFHGGIEYDFMFRYLSKSKMFINDETWSFIGDTDVQYLSEKTLIFLITAIPFIPTHHYPLELIDKYIDYKPHPLYDKVKKINRDIQMLTTLISEVMDDYDETYKKCKEWSDGLYTIIADRLRKENNLCDMLIEGFPTESKPSLL